MIGVLTCSAVGKAAAQIIAKNAGGEAWSKIDRAERAWADLPQIPMRLEHIFTPVPNEEGLFSYTRTIFMKAGEVYTTLIHLYDSPFVISSGEVAVFDGSDEVKIFKAPYVGVTKAGTRRALQIIKDCTWTAFFVSRLTDPDAIGAQITIDPTTLGHMDDVPEEKLAEIRNNHRVNKTLK